MSDPLKELQELHPVFVFKNKTSVPQPISLSTGSIQVQPHAEGKARSVDFSQLPSTKTFQFIKPSLQDLIAVGMIKSNASQSSDAKSDSSDNE